MQRESEPLTQADMPKAEVMRCANKVSLVHNNTETDVTQVYCISKQEQTEQQNLLSICFRFSHLGLSLHSQTALTQLLLQAV